MRQPSTTASGDRIAALLVTGHDHFHHRWRHAAALTRETLEASGRFSVTATEAPQTMTSETLAPYDCLLVSYFGARVPGEHELRWGSRAEAALFDFVRGGGGVVLLHTTFAMGTTWNDAHGDELLRLAGGLLGPESRRAPGERFVVSVEDPTHPITQGLPPTWEQAIDDKFVQLRWHAEASPHVLVTVEDEPEAYLGGAYYAVLGLPGPPLATEDEVRRLPGVGERHPVAWTNEFGRGRVFALMLGHVGASTIEDARASLESGREVGPTIDVAARTPGYVGLLVRGTEWAATGSVTLPPTTVSGGRPSS
ncbi:MAG: ThuA domain-containing protein [Gaiellaceae bacterium]|nr:ThuA domain-containing protein [Gaiellaceae bacterium]